MPLDPDAATLIAMMRAAGRPPMETLSPDEARQAFKAGRAVTQPDPQDVAEVRDLSCPGPGGQIPLRAYRPIGTKADEVLPVLMYFHGGGWLLGDLDSHDVACRHYANAARLRVVHHRQLAPDVDVSHVHPLSQGVQSRSTRRVACPGWRGIGRKRKR